MAGATDNINAFHESVLESDLIQGWKFWMRFVFDMGFALVMPILRRNFGERFFSLAIIIAIMSAVNISSLFFGLHTIAQTAYMALVLGFSFVHIVVIMLRNKRGEQWHTRYEGDFLPFFRFLPKASYWVIEGFYEPLFVGLIGVGFYFGGHENITAILVTSAILMFLRSQFNYSIHKTRILDQRDSMIEGEYAMEALNGSPSKETKGYIVKGAKSLSQQDKTALGKKILSSGEFDKNFPDSAKITISKDDMRVTA